MKMQRTQPPVGYRRPLHELLRAAARAVAGGGARERLERQVAGHFGAERAFAVSSGKAALTTILGALHALTGRSRVILPAYTCYSVPSAIVRAGLTPVPCDIARGTFDYDVERLQALMGPDVLCALSVHLFGIPADTRRLQRLCAPHDIFVVEDSAQAMGIASPEGEPLGTRGDVGFFSLGRGKNVTSGGGGLIVTRHPQIAEALDAAVGRLPAPTRGRAARTLAELVATSMLISPRLYWVPAGIPALKLGETMYDTTFPILRLSDLQAEVLAGWQEQLARLNAVRVAAGAHYVRSIGAAAGRRTDVPYLRFPLVLGDGRMRDRILAEGRTVGISVMYPDSVGGIPELKPLLSTHRFPEAERVARSLVTLPTHPLLTGADRARVCDVVNGAVARSAEEDGRRASA